MTTKHKNDCKMAFGRKDESCERCLELLNGSKPVKWNFGSSNTSIRKQLKSHSCLVSNCGIVCTAFDW